MICQIFKFILPDVTLECDPEASTPETACLDWEIDEYGDTVNCELEIHKGLPWDKQKLGRLAIGEENAVSERRIYGLKEDHKYDVSITLKALMTESIPFFTEEFNLTLTMGNTTGETQTVKIYSNDDEYITETFTFTTDSEGQISLKLSTTSANFQVDSISGICSI